MYRQVVTNKSGAEFWSKFYQADRLIAVNPRVCECMCSCHSWPQHPRTGCRTSGLGNPAYMLNVLIEYLAGHTAVSHVLFIKPRATAFGTCRRFVSAFSDDVWILVWNLKSRRMVWETGNLGWGWEMVSVKLCSIIHQHKGKNSASKRFYSLFVGR